MKVNTRVPITFETVEDIDARFQRVKIWLMHTGENYNRSYFDKDIVMQNMDSLKNTPLLGFIEASELGDKDFRGHEEVLIIKDGELATKYLGSAYGVIPESCNPRFEFKEGDDGIVREYLVVDALMWTKFDDAIEILNSDGEVNQSMELHEDYDGYWDENNLFHFTRFKFDGACMLGKDVLPAMQRASVEKVFSIDLIQSQVEEKVKEFNEYLKKQFSKEVEILTIEELLAKYSTTEEQLVEKGINVQDFSLEELEVKIQEAFEADVEEEPKNSDGEPEGEPENEENKDGEPEGEPEPEPEGEPEGEPSGEFNLKEKIMEKFNKRFELSHDDLRWKLYDNLDAHIQGATGKESWYYIKSVYDNYFIAEDDWENGYFKVEYAKDGDSISLGQVTEVFPMFLTSDEKGALELMRNSFEAYETENKELKEFKANIERESHEAKAEELFSKFQLEEEEIAELRQNVHNFSLEQLESKTYEVLGRKVATSKFAKKEPKAPLAIKFASVEKSTVSVDKYFEKYGIKK